MADPSRTCGNSIIAQINGEVVPMATGPETGCISPYSQRDGCVYDGEWLNQRWQAQQEQ